MQLTLLPISLNKQSQEIPKQFKLSVSDDVTAFMGRDASIEAQTQTLQYT